MRFVGLAIVAWATVAIAAPMMPASPDHSPPPPASADPDPIALAKGALADLEQVKTIYKDFSGSANDETAAQKMHREQTQHEQLQTIVNRQPNAHLREHFQRWSPHNMFSHQRGGGPAALKNWETQRTGYAKIVSGEAQPHESFDLRPPFVSEWRPSYWGHLPVGGR